MTQQTDHGGPEPIYAPFRRTGHRLHRSILGKHEELRRPTLRDTLMPSMSEVLRIGRAPRPLMSADLEERLRSAMLAEVDLEPGTTVRGLEHLSVHATLVGTDITVCHINATGVQIDVPPDTDSTLEGSASDGHGGPVEDVYPLEESGPARHTESGLLQEFTFTAVPLMVQGVSVDVEGEAVNVPFKWLEFDDGSLALGIPEQVTGRARRAVRLRLSAAITPGELLAAGMKGLRAELAHVRGVRIDREKLTVTQLGPRRIRLALNVRVRWRFLWSTFRARTDIHIDNRYVARLRATRITSTNVLVAVILGFFRGRINRELSAPMDLKEDLMPVTLLGLRIDADSDRVSVSVEAGLA